MEDSTIVGFKSLKPSSNFLLGLKNDDRAGVLLVLSSGLVVDKDISLSSTGNFVVILV